MEMTMNLPRNYVEIEEEEMMYLDGGTTYRGFAAARQISNMIAASIGWALSASKLSKYCLAAAGSCVGLAISVICALGVSMSVVNSIWGLAMVGAAMYYYRRQGGFKSTEVSVFGYTLWSYVKPLR